MIRVLAIACVFLLAWADGATSNQESEDKSQGRGTLTDSISYIAQSGDGVPIQYRVYGHGEPAVVLIHGWSCDSSYWSAQLDALSGQYTVVTVDLAGHGDSGRNRNDWSMGHFGDDVASVVRQLPHRRVVLVGHSLGGVAALEAAQRLGHRILGVINVDTFRDVGHPPMREQEIEVFFTPFRKNFSAVVRKLVLDSSFVEGVDPLLASRIANDMAAAPPDIAIQTGAARFRHDFDALLRGSKVPLVLINAAHGGPTEEMRIRGAAPGFRHAVVLDGVGHFLMIEQPQRFNRVLLREIEALMKGQSLKNDQGTSFNAQRSGDGDAMPSREH